MPYKDPAVQREYQRARRAERRADYLSDKHCVDCGSAENLEIDHRDPSRKTSHQIWSWRMDRMLAELADCDVRCRDCHQDRHAAERRRHGIGGYGRGCRCEECRTAKAQANARYRQRRGRNSNPGKRLCRPLPNHSATAPGDGQPYTTPDREEPRP